MLLISRPTWTLRISSAVFLTRICFECIIPRQNLGVASPRGHGQRKPRPGGTIRSLFELHAGRDAQQLPSTLLIEAFELPPKKEKVDWHTTTEDLISALGPVGQEYKRPKEFAHKIDLSYTDPLLAATDPRAAREEAATNSSRVGQAALPTNLTDVLKKHLRYVAPFLEYHSRTKEPLPRNDRLDRALLARFSDFKWLSGFGWEITDLMNWTWILAASTAERSSTRMALLAHISFENSGGGRTVPQNILLLVLRRRNNTARGLRHLLIYTWNLMRHAESVVQDFAIEVGNSDGRPRKTRVRHPTDESSGMQEDIFMVMIIRLLRHARRLWPAASESIASLLCRYLDGINFKRTKSPDQDNREEETDRLASMYNTILKLLAEPALSHPFQSATHQQRAQFIVLRRMNDFEPPLVVDRRGYRAVTSVQLMHKKTLREREWAHLKAKSWPPWKEEKYGLDADIGPEHGISRAKEALNRAKEAGYSSNTWDDAAALLSGWDTDGSPTIQTRSIHQPPIQVEAEDFEDATIWATRIRATRTLDEAWAAFLMYKDSPQKRHHIVYQAMFDKLFWDAKRISKGPNDPSIASYQDPEGPLPGDGLEVLPAPKSPREAIYVRTPPPDLEGFFQTMIDDGVRPRQRLLASLLKNAPTVAVGVQYLERSAIQRQYLSALLEQGTTPDKNTEKTSAIQQVPEYLFNAIISLLARSARTCFVQEYDRIPLSSPPVYSPSLFQNPLLYACRLMRCRKPLCRPPWISILAALSRTGVIVDTESRNFGQDKQDIIAWHTSCGLLEWMSELNISPDLDAFHALCVGLEKGIFATEKMVLRAQGMENVDPDIRPFAEDVLSKGLQIVTEIFKNCVRSECMQQEIPGAMLKDKSELDQEAETQVQISSAAANEKAIHPDSENPSSSSSVSEDPEDPEDPASPSSEEHRSFLPPTCLLPTLLSVPHPTHLHAFIRVLGFRCDYAAILDLVEWMALYSEEIAAAAAETQNGARMLRRCIIALRVFLERSWVGCYEGQSEGSGVRTPGGAVLKRDVELDVAGEEVIRAVREIVSERVGWGAWPAEEEVLGYVLKGRFV